YQRKKRIDELEILIRELEAEIDTITNELESASTAGALERVADLGEAYTTKEGLLNTALEEWTELAE
ncbi:MAG TPA: ABC transporter C-terminal domain-containing protein, partial [Aggregatilineales bacterium]|nr:ABC transporter C-terminal domain-containing protein [Aggregatilineales bacterium]